MPGETTEWRSLINKTNKSGPRILYQNYKTYHKTLKRLIRAAKQKYYTKKFEKSKGDKKKTWGIINELRGKAKNNIKSHFLIDNERVTCRRIIANKFNNYFVSLAKNLNRDAYSQIPITEFPSFESYLQKPCETSIFIEDCDPNEIENIIRELENGKSSDIPTVLIKRSCTIISPILADLYNYHIRSGIFPQILKVGKITPIYKKGNKELIEIYRPISTLPIFGKIFEKIIYNRLYNFFTSKGIISDSQFGFRKGHSTGHAIHYSVDIINQAHKLKKHVIGVFIDFSKAFDTLDHNILLRKLNNCGIRGIANRLIASYLSNREQYTNILGQNSDLEQVIMGVPQGSVLGPLLFLLYINDIKNCYGGSGCDFVLYADDTNLFIIDISREAAITKANEILNCIFNFTKSNLLHINLEKCCYMYFEPPIKAESSLSCARSRPFISKSNMPKIKINNHNIKEVKETKFLGVIIDNKLTWLPHIQHLHKKLKSATGILRRIRHHIPEENYKSIYYSLFESHLTYCITVFGGAKNTHLEKLFRVQKHCIRILFGNLDEYMEKFSTCARVRKFCEQVLGAEFYCKEHTKPVFSKLGILAVYNIYNYHMCLEVLKILKFRLPMSLYKLFQLSNRNNNTVLILPPKSPHLTYRASKIWNTAVKILAKNNDLLSLRIGPFKKNLRNCLLEIQNMYDKIEWYPQNFEIETALKTRIQQQNTTQNNFNYTNA